MKDTRNYISFETIQIITSKIDDLHLRKYDPDDIRMLFWIMYYCALRPSEAIRLKKDDFDLDRRVFFLGRTKTRKIDEVLIPSEFVGRLDAWITTRPAGKLWPGLTYITMYKWLERLGKLCQILAWTMPQSESGEKTKGHIFRKSFGKEMMSGRFGSGAQDPNQIAKHLRHSKPSVTIDKYLKASLESLREVL